MWNISRTFKHAILLQTLVLLTPSFGQTVTELSSLNSIQELLDGKVYSVPEYGLIKFGFNNKDYKVENEKLINSASCSADPVKYATFDVNVKKLDRKRYDNIDYKLKIEFPLNGEYKFKDPNQIYYSGFRFIEISEFPCSFLILASGQLFYEKTKYRKLSFTEVRNRLIGSNDPTSQFSYDGYSLYNYEKEWVECTLIQE